MKFNNSMMSDNWYKLTDIEEIDTPALVIFKERVIANIQTAISMVNDISRLRPHIKTNKSPDAVKLMIKFGISKFKCATIAEAEMAGMCLAKDVVLAYQPLGPKLQRFIQVIKKYPDTLYSCLADNLSAAEEQSSAFTAAELTVPVYMDLNIGMNRTGIIPGDDAVSLYSFLSAAPGLRVAGLHAYDGHFRNADIEIRTEECNNAFMQVEQLKKKLEADGLQVPNIIAGGSPTFPVHAKRMNCECSPGTFIYWDKGYTDLCPEQDFLPAAVLLTRIISCPSSTRVCTDLGHKSVSAENEISRRVHFLNTNDLQPVSHSEEHLVLEAKAGHPYQVGDVLYGLPYHVCPTVALYEKVYTIENQQVSGEWKNSARDREISV